VDRCSYTGFCRWERASVVESLDSVITVAVVVFAVVLVGALIFYFTSDEPETVHGGLILSVGVAFGVAVLVLCCGLMGWLRAA
jgi:hypothetical protein